MKRGWWIGKFIVFGLVALLVMGLVTMTLWNWLVPVLFKGPEVNFWQALGLLALSKILFWSFGGRGGHYRGGSWRWKTAHQMRQRWDAMSPEDRERFKQKMKEKWCGWDTTASGKDSDISNG